MSRSPFCYPAGGSMTDAIKAAQDICKQVLTVTTAVLAVTISFLKDVLHGVHGSDLIWIRLAWGTLLASLLLGFLAMGALTDELAAANPNVNSKPARITAIAHQGLFFVGIGLLTVFGMVTTYAQHGQ
jgi:uncharacterized membrane protein